MLNSEVSHVQLKVSSILEKETCLTLELDGWISPVGQSFYAFVVITQSDKEYIHSIQNLSKKVYNSSSSGNFYRRKLTQNLHHLCKLTQVT